MPCLLVVLSKSAHTVMTWFCKSGNLPISIYRHICFAKLTCGAFISSGVDHDSHGGVDRPELLQGLDIIEMGGPKARNNL